MTWRVNSWLIGELVIIKIPVDFLNNLIILSKVFSSMKGGDNSKKDKEIGRHGDKVKIIRVSALD